MRRYVRNPGQRGEFREVPEIDAFLQDIARVCRKHSMSISHEDSHGSFEIMMFNQKTMDWLNDASDNRKGTEQ